MFRPINGSAYLPIRKSVSPSQRVRLPLVENHPAKCAAVVGLAVNLVQLIACIIAPYMSDTAKAIIRRLRMDSLIPSDQWTADSIQPGHEIGIGSGVLVQPHQTLESSRMANNFWG